MLRASPDVLRERFLRRGWNPPLVGEAIREAAELEHATFAELGVDTGDRSVIEVARLVRARASGWPGLR